MSLPILMHSMLHCHAIRFLSSVMTAHNGQESLSHAAYWVTPCRLTSLKQLSVQNNRLTGLTGLEQCRALEELYVSHNGIESLVVSPCANLQGAELVPMSNMYKELFRLVPDMSTFTSVFDYLVLPRLHVLH